MTSGEIIMLCIGVATLGTTAINLVWTNVIARKTDRIDVLEDELKSAMVCTIEDKLGSLRSLNDERFIQVWKRFDSGDARFERLEGRDQKIELTIERRLHEIQSSLAVVKDRLGVREEGK